MNAMVPLSEGVPAIVPEKVPPENVLFVRVCEAAMRAIVSEATSGSVCCRAVVGPMVGATKFCPEATVMPASKV